MDELFIMFCQVVNILYLCRQKYIYSSKNTPMKQAFCLSLLFVTLIACQPSAEERASALITEAQALVETNQWRQARIMLDSLHITYPKEVDQRRLAKALEDSITYLEAQSTLAYVDTLLPPLLEQVDKLIKHFKYEKNEAYESNGKYVHRLLSTNSNTSRNFLQAYVLDNRETVVKSYYYGDKQVNQEELRLHANGEEIIFSGRNHHFLDEAHHEIMTLSEDKALSLLNFISTHHDAKFRVEGIGDKPTRNWVYYLNEKEKEALSETYRFGILMKDINQLEQMQRVATAQINHYTQK